MLLTDKLQYNMSTTTTKRIYMCVSKHSQGSQGSCLHHSSFAGFNQLALGSYMWFILVVAIDNQRMFTVMYYSNQYWSNTIQLGMGHCGREVTVSKEVTVSNLESIGPSPLLDQSLLRMKIFIWESKMMGLR